MKYYLIPLYNANAEIGDPNRGKIEMIDKVIVKHDEFTDTFHEIVTGAYLPDYVDWQFRVETILNLNFIDTRRYDDCGYHLLIKKKDINEENEVGVEELAAYMEQYESSKWKKTHDEIVTTVGKKYIKRIK